MRLHQTALLRRWNEVVALTKRYVLTGAPGAGKTSIVDVLRTRGFAVVSEAATDVIAASTIPEPWTRVGFCDDIVSLQRRREEQPTDAAVQLFDRSPLCTLALARWLGHPVSALLAAEVEHAITVYAPLAFLVRPLGFITGTEARRISYADSLAFGLVHEQVYAEHGFTLVDVAPGEVAGRADFVEAKIHA